MTDKNIQRKSNSFLLSNQVKAILTSKGFSAIFNFADYKHFKTQCKNAFNKAQAIAERFIEDAEPNQNDYKDYIF